MTAGWYKYLATLGANLLFYKLTAVSCKPFSLALLPVGFLSCSLLLQPFRRCLCFLCLYLGNFLRRAVDIDLPNIVKATPHNAIKEKNGEQPTRKQLEALLNLFARQQQIKPSDRVRQRGLDLPMRAGYSLLQFAFASLGIVSFGIEAGASKPQRHVRLWHEPKISHARAA